jgi:hypothetical protein
VEVWIRTTVSIIDCLGWGCFGLVSSTAIHQDVAYERNMNYKHIRHTTLNLYPMPVVMNLSVSAWYNIFTLSGPTRPHRPHPSRPHTAPSAVHSSVWNLWCRVWHLDKSTTRQGVEIWSLWGCKSQILEQRWLLLAGEKSLWHLKIKAAVSF